MSKKMMLALALLGVLALAWYYTSTHAKPTGDVGRYTAPQHN